ncbi:site-specific DNA-methyltransferase [Caldilinea sp.]|uniref:site-specific DNA-methyltransferase n=1 Tax=Caldilinea sp. TaxID=2293560 RepID=UPI002CC99DEB|nr:site-specific DNA-methyltransferase [Caldilinea sp.]
MSVVLTWPGKQAPGAVAAAQPRLVETFEPHRFLEATAASSVPTEASAANAPHPSPLAPPNALYHGDNLGILARLLDSGCGGKVRLIYADPPYDSGVAWTRKVRLRQPRRNGVDPVVMQQVQYGDAWPEGAYLQFIYERLPLLRALLADDGSLWLHCDQRRAHHLRCLLDEVFGAEHYLNTITWRSQTARGAKVNAFYFPNSAHTILVYARNRTAPTTWHPPRRRILLTEAQAAAEFMCDELGFFRTSDPGAYTFDSLKKLAAEGRLYAPFGGEVAVDEAQQRVFASNGGNLGVKYYLTKVGRNRYQVERAVDNIWDDIVGLGTTPGEDLGYPTQKTEALLERILTTGSDPGDLVLDPFCGSGTTPAVAAKRGRRWIACDANYGAIQTTTRRLQGIFIVPSFSIQPDRSDQDKGVGNQAGFAVYAATDFPATQNIEPEVTLSITRIDADPGTIEVIVRAVRAPSLSGIGENLAEAAWPALVDSIAIDPAYDGQVFRATVADAPLKKRTTVAGRYQVTTPSLPATVAVRIVDITGGERIVTCRIKE